VAGVGAFANTAKAETIYTTTTAAPVAVVTTSGHETVNQSYTAVGTRKVGLVGYHPYPMKASHVESSTVRVSEPSTSVVYTPVNAGSTSVSTVTTTDGAPIQYSTGGGDYYTEDGVRYYQNPALNINVRRTGSFND
jgi:hypothetical protein